MTASLPDLAAGTVGIFLLVFARIGSALFLLPGVGESEVPVRIRLAFALALSALLAPVLAPGLPPVPGEPTALTLLIGGEVLLGLAIGFAARLLLAALNIAGTIMAMQSGLATAAFFDPSESSQRSIFVIYLSAVAFPLIFALDGHHWLLGGLASSYASFPPGQPLPVGDLVELVTRLCGIAFSVGFRMAAPLVLMSLATNLAIGLLNRMMPTLQALMIALPAQVLVGLAVTALSLAASLAIAVEFLRQTTVWLG